MASDLLLDQLDYVFFLYGLGFILLSASALLVARSGKAWKPWGFLCLFAVTHAGLEWLDLGAMNLGDNATFALLRTLVMGISYVFLCEFARRTQRTLTPSRPSSWIPAALALIGLSGFFGGTAQAQATLRYALAFPGALWAAWALWRYRVLTATPGWPLAAAACAMTLYAPAAGLVVAPAAFFPADILNQQTFLATFGFPVQVLRTALAMTMAAAIWQVSLSTAGSRRREARLPSPSGSNLRMVLGLAFILAAGWFFTQEAERRSQEKDRILGQAAMEITARNIGAPLASADRFSLFLASRLTQLFSTFPAHNRSSAVDNLLDSLAEAIPGSVAYLMDTGGLVINSSNRNTPQSLLGSVFAIRPYFSQAILSGVGRFVAMGTLSGVPGYYAGSRVELASGEVVGVAVIKINLDKLETSLVGGGTALLTDAGGVVMAATNPKYLSRPLAPLTPEALTALKGSKLYDTLDNDPILLQGVNALGETILDGKTALVRRHVWAGGGLGLVVLDPVADSGPVRLWAILLVMLCALLHVVLTTLRRQERESALSLADSNRRYLQMFEGSRSVQLLIDPATSRIQDANPAALAFYGFTKSELKNKSITQINLLPRQELFKSLNLALATPSTFHMRHMSAKGVRDVEVNSARVETGGKVLLHSIIHDITERLAGEQAMAEVLDLNRKIIEHSPLGIIAYKGSGPCVLANKASADILGTTQDELLSQNFRSVECGVTFGLTSEALASLESGEPRLREGHFISAFGRGVRVDLIFASFTSSAEPHLLLIMNDVTHTFEAKQTLERAKTLAEEATRAKSEFLANVSHEIRTPMNAILGLTHLSLRTELNPKQRDYLEKIQTAARTLLGLLNDVLDLSKIEAGKFLFEERTFFLEKVLGDIAGVLAVKAAEKGLELLFCVDPSTPLTLVGDPMRLGQVLTNLIDNAIKFTKHGEVTVQIGPAKNEGEQVQVAFLVRDTGIGIPDSLHAKLFTPFTQADGSTTRQFGGTGLGLSISKSLVELMGGTIRLSSDPGQGSTFTFALPFGRTDSHSTYAELAPSRLKGFKALAVDDCPAALNALARHLNLLGFETVTAQNGAQALDTLGKNTLAGEKPFDLVALDWQMPGLDGLETAARIKNAPGATPRPKLLLLSAFDRDELAGLAGQSGVDRVVLKPVLPSALLQAASLLLLGAAEAPLSLRQGPQYEPSGLEGCRVLLAEDNPINQQVAVELLRAAGLEVDLAANGQEAVDKVSRLGGQYHAVLMDVQMPFMNGLEAARVIRNRLGRTGLPIIAMTAHAMEQEIQACLDAGMTDHVAKPVEPDNLLATLAKWIRPAPGRIHARPRLTSKIEMHLANMRVPDYPGVDSAAALKRLGGNAALYLELMRQFCASHAFFANEMQSAVEALDWPGAAGKAHTLKGVAGNLGAQALAAAAQQLELAALQKDTKKALTLIETVVELLDPVVAAVHATDSGAAEGFAAFTAVPEES